MAESLYSRLGGYDGIARELGVGPTEGGEVMDFLNSLKGDIVTA